MNALGKLPGRSIAIILIIPIAAHLIFAESQKKNIDVPYVPTPYKAVEEMLRLAEMDENDSLYDLGCGDGRIVIMAAQKYSARGVGIDIDPRRIQESRQNAAKAKVEHLVEFREGNFFSADFSEASVVTLYLLTKINIDLRSKLLQELKPGSRIVSHKFKMGEWLPDKTSAVYINNIQHPIFYWTVPANISGQWNLILDKRPTKVHYRLDLEQLFQFVQGSMTVGQSLHRMKTTWLDGDRFGFTVAIKKGSPCRFEGQVQGNSMTGKAIQDEEARTIIHTWKAQRKPFTMKPLDPLKSPTSSLFEFINSP